MIPRKFSNHSQQLIFSDLCPHDRSINYYPHTDSIELDHNAPDARSPINGYKAYNHIQLNMKGIQVNTILALTEVWAAVKVII